ncbi:LCP family protein [Nocardioides bruguierae]|uniref:LCP family protein n=1 Tax=Nocardioides bruguierae TaxID=2945102 RepID=A0A9X2IF34_9ACTN|nr:LCP family protein [Nocardioides bruguierae]MCM0621441.1 LCP family protein [Nocardioides bruguierae]
MSDEPTTGGPAEPAAADEARPAPRAGRRRARPRRGRAVLRAIVSTLVVLAMVSGLGAVWFYRHLNSNLTVADVTAQLSDRPTQVEVEGPQEPLNILVMGIDDRSCDGCGIDKESGADGSDNTLLIHLSADRSRAYGVSIPRDSMVDRPECTDDDGGSLPAEDYAMWNAAFSVGGAACTIQQFESLTDIRLDHYVVVDFGSFKDMVDAVGGVEMCIPYDIDDSAHNIYLEAGTRTLEGDEALAYVRERYAVSGGSDLGRMKRQQAFLASMAHTVVSANTLANPLRLTRFLDAATSSLTVDSGLGSISKLADLGYQFRNISLDGIQFITIPNTVDPNNPNRLVWTEDAAKVWRKLRNDKPLTSSIATDAISAGSLPGSDSASDSASASSSPSASSSTGTKKNKKKGSGGAALADEDALAAAGLCT